MHIAISTSQAREYLLRKHGLLGPSPFQGKAGVMDYVRQVGCVQYDPVDVCGKSHELAFLTRVKGFHRDMLRELLYEDRALLDYWDKMMSLVLTEEWPCFEPMRERYRQESRSQEAVASVEEDIRRYLKQHGHASSRELPIQGKVDWYWSATALSRAALESMYYRGELVVHHKRHTVKSYALAEDHLPGTLLNAPFPFKNSEDQHAWQALRRIGAVGMLWNKPSDAWLGIPDFTARARDATFTRLRSEQLVRPVTMDGMEMYIRREDEDLLRASERPFHGKKRVHFLAPLDCLMWDRKLINALFGFSYQWEIYNPESRRKYSYYVLPVVYGSRFAGRVEPVADRKQGMLKMKRFWPEKGFLQTQAFRTAMKEEAAQLAAFHNLENVVWEEAFWHNQPNHVTIRKVRE